jgi:GTP-binding protein
LLLHLVDIAPVDEQADPVDQVRRIEAELEKFGGNLLSRERWLVLNKADLLPEDELNARRDRMLAELNWAGRVFAISALTGSGVGRLMAALMERLEALREAEQAAGSAPEDDRPWDPLGNP